jgi:NMD protein affecting ribosome stability and mRNA decay
MGAEPLTNLDLLEWFADDERGVCGSCGRRACVSLPEVAASFCLGCGAITIGGMRIDAGRMIPVDL